MKTNIYNLIVHTLHEIKVKMLTNTQFQYLLEQFNFK